MILSKDNGRANVGRVMLVDDHAIVRKGLRSLIEGLGGWDICGEASDGIDAVEMAAQIRPDVVIMDLSMPGMSGLEATHEITQAAPEVEVLILTMRESDLMAGQAMRAGARGYLRKNESEDKLQHALDALSRHQPYPSPAASGRLPGGYSASAGAEDREELTPRERQIVTLVAEGNSNKVIARILSLSIKTVETHRSAAMHKVGARSAAELTLYAARNDLVQL